MKLCHTHFTSLYRAVVHKGMGHLISTDSVEMTAKATRWVKGEIRDGDFDPLAVSVLEIYQKATHKMNLDLRERIVGRVCCPLCEAESDFGQGMDVAWIENCTDAVRAMSISSGLSKGSVN